MASIFKDGTSWRAQIRRKGYPTQTASFGTKLQAERWARSIEQQMDTRTFVAPTTETLRDVLERYQRDVTPGKRGHRWEDVRITKLLADLEFVDKPVSEVSPADVRAWRDERLKLVKSSSVNREMNVLSAVFTHAIKEWGISMRGNPVFDVKRPVDPPPRNQRWDAVAIEAVLQGAGFDEEVAPTTAKSYVPWVFLFALETAMRKGEILALTRGDIDLQRRVAHVARSKNGDERDVPLTRRAVELLQGVMRSGAPGLFQINSGTFDAYWRELRHKGHTFHDTRREATSRLAAIFPVHELAKITGHRDIKVLYSTYYAPKVDDFVSRLDAAAPQLAPSKPRRSKRASARSAPQAPEQASGETLDAG